MKKYIQLLAASAFLTSSAYALELPKNANQVSDSDAIGVFVNRKLNVTIYNTKSGKRIGSGTLHHRADGKKAINITVSGKRVRKTLKWNVSGSRLCAGSLGTGKTICGTQGHLYKLGNQCFYSRDGKMVGTAFKC